MKVLITTIRVMPDDSLDRWLRQLINIGIPIDAKKFKETKVFEMDCDNVYTKAHTKYEILEENP